MDLLGIMFEHVPVSLIQVVISVFILDDHILSDICHPPGCFVGALVFSLDGSACIAATSVRGGRRA